MFPHRLVSLRLVCWQRKLFEAKDALQRSDTARAAAEAAREASEEEAKAAVREARRQCAEADDLKVASANTTCSHHIIPRSCGHTAACLVISNASITRRCCCVLAG